MKPFPIKLMQVYTDWGMR